MAIHTLPIQYDERTYIGAKYASESGTRVLAFEF